MEMLKMDNQETTLAVLSAKFDVLHGDVTDMKKAMKEVASALTKLTLVEERQANSNNAQKRFAEKLDALEARIDTLEKADVSHDQAAKWVMHAVWGAAGLAAMYVAKTVGLL
jgi:dynactin complex subunit